MSQRDAIFANTTFISKINPIIRPDVRIILYYDYNICMYAVTQNREHRKQIIISCKWPVCAEEIVSGGGHVLRMTFEPCRLYGDGRKSGGGHMTPVSDAHGVY